MYLFSKFGGQSPIHWAWVSSRVTCSNGPAVARTGASSAAGGNGQPVGHPRLALSTPSRAPGDGAAGTGALTPQAPASGRWCLRGGCSLPPTQRPSSPLLGAWKARSKRSSHISSKVFCATLFPRVREGLQTEGTTPNPKALGDARLLRSQTWAGPDRQRHPVPCFLSALHEASISGDQGAPSPPPPPSA